jgi:uncharacterized RDD family membrane protein YckC
VGADPAVQGNPWDEWDRAPTAPAARAASLAGYGYRLVGWLIDWVLTGVLGFGLAAILGQAHSSSTRVSSGLNITLNSSLYVVTVPGVLVVVAVVLAYCSVLIGLWGSTLGMRTVGVRCTHEDATRRDEPGVGVGRALGRSAFEYLLFFFVFFPWVLDMLWPAWDRANQTLHDKVARTVVVHRGG